MAICNGRAASPSAVVALMQRYTDNKNSTRLLDSDARLRSVIQFAHFQVTFQFTLHSLQCIVDRFDVTV